jgi:acetyl esterase/lipase
MSSSHALFAATLLAALPALLHAEAVKKTHTFKTVGKLPIKADVYREADDKVRPVLVWIHGGALINGHREGLPKRLKDDALAAGWVFVSIDYRLAPETKLPDIIADIEDAMKWVHEKGPALFNADPKRIAVAGGSAGGYLALTAGYRAKPRAVAVLSYWGYGDLVGDWYSKPSKHPRHNRVKVTREEALKQVMGPPISDSRNRKGDGGKFYNYCRQTGEWPMRVSGWDPVKEVEKFAPFMPVRNVDREYPPTLLIHGEEDTDVPHEQSVMMARELKKHGVEHRLISVPKAEHGLQGGDKALIEKTNVAALAFLKKHLSGK